jgi:site-specific recombinase XerD
MKQLTLTECIAGFLLEKQAQHLSPHTVADYSNAFRKFQAYLGADVPLAGITPAQVKSFLADLSEPRAPSGAAPRPVKGLSNKSILNIHTGLSALWTWAVAEGVVQRHLLREIPRPRPEKRVINPFTLDDVKKLLGACERSRTYSRPGKATCDHTVPTGLRNRAMILLLVDTGIRASELCGLTSKDADLTNRHILVLGKGNKERSLPISARTAKMVWRYLTTERKDERVDRPLFVSNTDDPMTRDGLLRVLKRLGEKAGVPNCYPHRFRHTFALSFLRNGGNAFELQMALGHTTLEMVQTYLTLAQTDLDEAHRRASPVENWRL